MKQKIIVLGAKPYRVQDEKTGQVNEGVSLFVLLNETLNPCDGERGMKGYETAKMNFPALNFSQIPFCPAYYMATQGIKMVGGKPQITITGLEFIACIDAKEDIATNANGGATSQGVKK